MKQRIIGLLLIMMTACPLTGQVIERVVPNFVLINTDIGLGQPGKTLWVYRIYNDQIFYTGKVKILRFQEGKTAAQILEQAPLLTIQPGDRVLGERIKNSKLSDPRSLIPQTPRESTQENLISPQESPQENRITTWENTPASSAASFAGPTPALGIHVARFIPQAALSSFENSFLFGVSLRLIRAGRHNLRVDAAYPLLTMKTPVPEVKTSLITAHLVDHIRVGDQGHYDIGGGLYYFTWKGPDPAGGTVTESDSYFGFFFGYSIDIPVAGGFVAAPNFRIHLYQMEPVPGEKEWSGYASGGVTVHIPIL